MPQRNLPLLEVGKAYVAADFERFSYSAVELTGSKASLRLHLKNGTTIDLPSTREALTDLLVNLCEAFPKEAAEHVKKRGWIETHGLS